MMENKGSRRAGYAEQEMVCSCNSDEDVPQFIIRIRVDLCSYAYYNKSEYSIYIIGNADEAGIPIAVVQELFDKLSAAEKLFALG